MFVSISVIIPVYNAAGFLDEQLAALGRQSYRGDWELILADNGSTDGSRAVAEAWRDRLPGLRIVDASARPGAAAARNVGAASASGDVLAFCDADDVVASGWLEAIVGALLEHDFVAGARDHHSLNPGPTVAYHAHSHVTGLRAHSGFKPYAVSSNMAVSRRAFEQVGGFPEDLKGLRAAGDDVDLSWRLQLAGHELHFEPRAVVAYRHRHRLRDVWRQHVGYGRVEPLLLRRFQRCGVPASGVAIRAWIKVVRELPKVLRAETRGEWLRLTAYRFGRLVGSMREGVLHL